MAFFANNRRKIQVSFIIFFSCTRGKEAPDHFLPSCRRQSVLVDPFCLCRTDKQTGISPDSINQCVANVSSSRARWELHLSMQQSRLLTDSEVQSISWSQSTHIFQEHEAQWIMLLIEWIMSLVGSADLCIKRVPPLSNSICGQCSVGAEDND